MKPVSYEELLAISKQFDPSLPLYIATRKRAEASVSGYSEEEILETLAMRPLTPEDIEVLFDRESQNRVAGLLKEGKLKIIESHGVKFYKKS